VWYCGVDTYSTAEYLKWRPKIGSGNNSNSCVDNTVLHRACRLHTYLNDRVLHHIRTFSVALLTVHNVEMLLLPVMSNYNALVIFIFGVQNYDTGQL